MGLSYTALGILVLTFFIVNFSGAADLEVQGDPKTDKNVKDSEISNKGDNGKEKVVIPETKGKDQLGNGLKKGPDDKINEEKNGKDQEGLKGAGGELKKMDDTGGEQKKTDTKVSGEDTGVQEKKTDNKVSGEDTGAEQKRTDNTASEQKTTINKASELKKSDDTGSEHDKPNDTGTKKGVEKKEKAQGDSGSQSKDVSVSQKRKEGGEVCDSSSNMCTIKEKSVIACLRVAGSESEGFSLLIQNKGSEPVSVTISAPDFVQLEKKQIQVQDNNNEKVKVSIGEGESKSGIILKAGSGHCTIEIKEMSSHSSKKDSVSSQLAYINFLKSKPSVWFVFFAAVLVIASVCIGKRFRQKHVARNSPGYEKLEMELPVSGAREVAPDSNDGWDDSWGDSWDDEEAPKTPSMPVTPSLSSHGMASRRVNKDAWKD